METFHLVLENFHGVLETLHGVLETLHDVMETFHDVLKTLHDIVETFIPAKNVFSQVGGFLKCLILWLLLKTDDAPLIPRKGNSIVFSKKNETFGTIKVITLQ